MVRPQPQFDSKRFTEKLDELGERERSPRLIDVLLEHQERIILRLKEASCDKEIYDALRAAGYTVSYPAFQRAMKQFRDMLKLPTRKEARRLALHAGRFLRTSGQASQPACRAPLRTGTKGKLELLNTENPLRQAARAI